jgi:hypothetical protein
LIEEHNVMKFLGRCGFRGLLIALAFFLGCTMPSSGTQPPLSAAAAQATLDSWNPSYCKVEKFYGFYKPEASGAAQVAYVSLINPGDKAQKPAVYAADFQLLTLADGRQQWVLTGLVLHSSGLTRRQGWDNLMVPLQEAAAAPAEK